MYTITSHRRLSFFLSLTRLESEKERSFRFIRLAISFGERKECRNSTFYCLPFLL